MKLDVDDIAGLDTWTTAYVNELPDSAFLYIEAGGKKDSEGKTTPRSLRHFPYKDSSGKVDLPHLRNALSRIPQSSLPASVKSTLTTKAQRLLGASDSRACMEKIAKLLGLDKEATEEQIVEALESRPDLKKVLEPLGLELKDDASEEEIVEAVKAKAEEKEGDDEELSLEDRAKQEGKKVLSASDFQALKSDAAAGRKAADELHQAKFDRAFEKALDEVRVDAKDETRELYEELYEEAPEQTLKLLEGLPKLASTSRRGSGGGPRTDDAPDGVDPDRHDLDTAVKAYMKEHKDVDYEDALDVVLAERSEG